MHTRSKCPMVNTVGSCFVWFCDFMLICKHILLLLNLFCLGDPKFTTHRHSSAHSCEIILPWLTFFPQEMNNPRWFQSPFVTFFSCLHLSLSMLCKKSNAIVDNATGFQNIVWKAGTIEHWHFYITIGHSQFLHMFEKIMFMTQHALVSAARRSLELILPNQFHQMSNCVLDCPVIPDLC